MKDQTKWDNSHIFKDLSDPGISQVFATAKKSIGTMANLVSDFNKDNDTNSAINIINFFHTIEMDLYTCNTFFYSVISVDTKNEQANKLLSTLEMIVSELYKVFTPVGIFMDTCSEEDISKILLDDEIKHGAFNINYSRKTKDFVLSNKEESLITGLSADGISAWGKLYSSISGTMECVVRDEDIGYANAAANLSSSDATLRKESWQAIQKSWSTHEQSASAILNAINGWRNEELKLRSKSAGRELNALDMATNSAKISRKTLNTLMSATYKNRKTGQRALLAMSKARGEEVAHPWDLKAGPPASDGKSSNYSFSQGMELIIEAFNSFSSEMGDFAKMMWDNNWIDALPTPARRPGAYCTQFAKQREPRVFMTYNGSMGDIITLAHELGHAFHSWVMKDMHIRKTSYPMTLAETASIFAETLVRDYLYDQAKTDQEKFDICWEDASSAEGMLCNIPARFEFEKSLVIARQAGEQSPNDLRALMGSAWKNWYGNSLSEYDEMFWASKLHFSIASLSFYNYPYLFGYLFSLGIYAQKDKMGDGFVELYKEILRDTGSMTAEELISKHLGKDIEQTEFWQDSLDIVEKAVSRFEKLL